MRPRLLLDVVEEEANPFIGRRLGLPALPWIHWAPEREASPGLSWKTPQIVAWAEGRPFAWVDDEITDADRAWVAAHHSGPAHLHRVDPHHGLRADDFTRLTAWATAHAADGPA